MKTLAVETLREAATVRVTGTDWLGALENVCKGGLSVTSLIAMTKCLARAIYGRQAGGESVTVGRGRRRAVCATVDSVSAAGKLRQIALVLRSRSPFHPV